MHVLDRFTRVIPRRFGILRGMTRVKQYAGLSPAFVLLFASYARASAQVTPTSTPRALVVEYFSPAVLTPWSQPMGNPQHTGLSPFAGTNAGTFMWLHNTGGQVMSTPIVYNGLLIVLSCSGKLTALNASTGGTVWVNQVQGASIGGPCRSNGAIDALGYLFIGTGGPATFYPVYLTVLNPATGAILDSTLSPTGNEYGNVLATPHGHVVVGNTDGCTRMWYGGLVGIAGASSYWCFGTPGYPMAAPSASLDGNMLFIAGMGVDEPNSDPSVYAVYTAAGRKMWQFTPAASGGVAVTSPLVTPWGSVVVGYTNGYVYSLSAATGALLWTFNSGSTSTACYPALGADGASVVAGCHNLYSLDAATGAVRWNVSFPANDDGIVPPVSQPPTASSADGVVYACVDIRVYGLDGVSGAVLWSFAASGAVSTSVSIGSDGIIYFGSLDSNVYALHGHFASPTPTGSGSPVPTATATSTASSTPSSSGSATAEPTGTSSFTHWTSYSRTATQSPSATRTPTRTTTATKTPTRTTSATKTPTKTPSSKAKL